MTIEGSPESGSLKCVGSGLKRRQFGGLTNRRLKFDGWTSQSGAYCTSAELKKRILADMQPTITPEELTELAGASRMVNKLSGEGCPTR